jgi:hypothetical protein
MEQIDAPCMYQKSAPTGELSSSHPAHSSEPQRSLPLHLPISAGSRSEQERTVTSDHRPEQGHITARSNRPAQGHIRERNNRPVQGQQRQHWLTYSTHPCPPPRPHHLCTPTLDIHTIADCYPPETIIVLHHHLKPGSLVRLLLCCQRFLQRSV